MRLQRKINEALGRAIRDRRKKLKLTQEELSGSAKLHPTYIGHIERGAKTPSLPVFVRIATHLRMTPQRLLTEAGI